MRACVQAVTCCTSSNVGIASAWHARVPLSPCTRTPFSIVEPDTLVRVPGDGADVIEVGSTGSACIWALAPFGDTLYGLTCTGRLTVIDVRTGTGRVLESDLSIRCNGAAAR